MKTKRDADLFSTEDE